MVLTKGTFISNLFFLEWDEDLVNLGSWVKIPDMSVQRCSIQSKMIGVDSLMFGPDEKIFSISHKFLVWFYEFLFGNLVYAIWDFELVCNVHEIVAELI